MTLENYYLYRLAIWLEAHLPRAVIEFGATVAASLSFLLNGRARRGLMANQAHVLPPGASRRQRLRIAWAAFRYSALAIVDFFRIPEMRRDNLDRFVAEFIGWQHVEAAMAAGVGGIFVTPHMGSWEMAGAYVGLRGVPLTVAALPHKDPRIDRIFIEMRERTGMEAVPIGGAMRRLQSALPRGRFIALLADRDVSGHGLVLPFFGQATRVPVGHAKLALRTGAWLLPACAYRRRDGRVVIEVRPPIVPDRASDTVEGLTLRCLQILEEFIRARPEQWASFYDLWDDAEAPPRESPGSAG